MHMNHSSAYIAEGRAVLGVELGSTRIKAVLIGENHAPIASGDHTWENRLENGVWTYHLDDVWAGIQDAYAALAHNVEELYGVKLTKLAGLGVSAMMHGYLPFDKDWNQLCEFRTWRNTMTGQAAEELTALLLDAFEVDEETAARDVRGFIATAIRVGYVKDEDKEE